MDKLNDESLIRMQTLEDTETIKNNISDLINYCVKKENIILRRSNIDDYKRNMMDKFYYIHQKYPTLFFTIIENPTTFPISRLEEMLSLKKQIENNTTTNDEASIHLGQKYFNEFVKDTVKDLDNNLDKTTIQDFDKDINKNLIKKYS
jgi:hypothetical protein